MKNREYIVISYPNINVSSTKMIIEVNFDDITVHLLIQRIINNYYIPTGIIFILIGIFLCFFGFYQDIAKLIISIIFGELITFIILVIIADISIKYFELLFIGIGLILGVIIAYFSLFYINFYKIIISFTSGIIFGLIFVNILFINNMTQLIISILADSIIISSISFYISLKILKKYYIFLNSIIGGYILIRGLSILLFKILRYRELFLMIYFMENHEWDYFDNSNRKLNWGYFWVYDLLTFVCIIISIYFYYFHISNYSHKSDNETELDDKSVEEEEQNSDSFNAN